MKALRSNASPETILRAFEVTEPPVPAGKIVRAIDDIQITENANIGNAFVIVHVASSNCHAKFSRRATRSAKEARVSFAWALGEVLLEPPGSYEAGESYSGPGLQFALQLLMPRRWFRLYLDYYHWDTKMVAKAFDVGIRTVNHRIADLRACGYL